MKNKEERTLDLFTLTKGKLQVIENILSNLQYHFDDLLKKTVEDGQEQAVDYNGDLRWEDEEHTIPKMRTKWKTIPISKESLDDDDYAKLVAIEQIIEILKKSF